jgi:hypothetical protein
MPDYHIAQINIGRIRAELDDPIMAGFANALDEINALADASPGFVWRLQNESGNNTYLRPFEDNRLLLNMSVWETVEQLRHFVYKTAHVQFLRRRAEWFEKLDRVITALWWVPQGHIPGVDEANRRLAHLDAHGPTQFAFTFQQVFPPDDEFQRAIDWKSFVPCGAT